ncbi:J domain-containing protein [Candidatus Dependentiae bacterium]|nr:J domain-containing protein [Candidatus Dependentiae bacterium]
MKKILLLTNIFIFNLVYCQIQQNGGAYRLLSVYANKTNGFAKKPIVLTKSSATYELLNIPTNLTLPEIKQAYLKILKTFEYLRKQPDTRNLYNELKTIVSNAYSLLKHYKLIDKNLTEKSTAFQILGISPKANKCDINDAFNKRADQMKANIEYFKEPNQIPNSLMESKIAGLVLQKAYSEAIKGK